MTSAKTPPFLPEEIWQRVALSMTTKDWVRISATCKEFHELTLPRIELFSATARSVPWAEDRWQHARGLTLHLKGVELPELQISKAAALHDLSELCLVLQDELFGPTTEYIERMLTHADQLKLLFVNTEAVISLPQFAVLHHVGLENMSFDGPLLEGLGHLANLQTLSLIGSDPFQESGMLDLSMLANLQDVNIQNVALAGLILPLRSRLHVSVGNGVNDMLQWWSQAAENDCLKRFRLAELSADYDVPPDLFESVSCKVLQWLVQDLGFPWQAAVLSGALFSNLRALYMQGNNLYLSLPSSMEQLEVFHVSSQHLSLNIENPDLLAGHLQEFSMTFVMLNGSGHILLAAALAKVGKHVNSVVDLEDDWSAVFLKLCVAVNDDWPCDCCACWRCLHARGIVQYLTPG